ncbi:PPC domain-containing DNA-binding protein [Chitinivibrio alkaliphilus]|uniref:Putative DNA-binding protein n=1 Tax=Chitinivibrio alkaliphilus ACht1 TaxID=1313304 RepID=U7D919_9BACT|nr:PPC domain-containing DNA-binding protein [Chitinivibrio alkaliphilus]ERP30890.1 putative DNA-binding protein [Chitinivibrio alkaliphilus ACht1]
MFVKGFSVQETLVGSFDHGDDLLLSLKQLCKERDISAGRIEVIGSVEEAKIKYFYKKRKMFDGVFYRKSMEIVSCIGTITTHEGEPFIHCHISLADHEGVLYGGHLAEGTRLYSSEFNIAVYEYSGKTLERHHDAESNLLLLK